MTVMDHTKHRNTVEAVVLVQHKDDSGQMDQRNFL